MPPYLSAIVAIAWTIAAPLAQGAPQAPTPLQVLKITAGPSGSEEKGSFVRIVRGFVRITP